MNRDETIILGAIFLALAESMPDSAMTHAVATLNKIADEDGSRRGHIMKIIARGLAEGHASIIKAV